MDLDQNYLIFLIASIFIILVLGKSSKQPDDKDHNDLEVITDVEILNIALSDLSQLEN